MAPRKARKIRVPTESYLPGRLAGTPSESQSTSVSAKRLAPTGEPLPASPSALCQLGHLKWSWTRGRGLEARQGRVWGGEIRRADMPSSIYANLAAGWGEEEEPPTPPRDRLWPTGRRGAETEAAGLGTANARPQWLLAESPEMRAWETYPFAGSSAQSPPPARGPHLESATGAFHGTRVAGEGVPKA